jgi:hypothetical protein
MRAFIALVLFAAACGGGDYVRKYPEPSVDKVVGHVQQQTDKVTSFQSESKMDYWLKKNRVRGTVLLLGKPGAHLRFNAENPTGGNVAVDLACDGVGYQMIDYNNNCQAVGPCTKDTIAALFKVALDPDDFYALAVGSTPVIPNPTGKVKWDENEGHEVLTLQSGNKQWSQVIVLDGRDQRWDVLESTVYDRFGEVEWKLENKSFYEVKTANGDTVRVPKKTKFVQPKQKADLAIIWKEHAFNMPLNQAKFTMQIPAGLAQCP